MLRPYLFLFTFFILFSFQDSAQTNTTLNADKFEKLKSATFKDLQGKEFTLAQYKGKIIIVDFWETWCGPCMQSMSTINKVAEKYKDKVIVLAVNALMKDDEKAFQHYCEKHQNRLVYATSNQLLKKIDVHFIPFKIFIDSNGNFVDSYESIQENTEDEYQEIINKIKPLIK